MTEEIKRIPVTDPAVIPLVDEQSTAVVETEEQNQSSEQEEKDAEVLAAAEDDDNEEAAVYKENGSPTPMEAIKAKCDDCSCGQRKERLLCAVKGCSLWPFRKGRKPVKRHVSEEFRAAASERFKKMHADKKAAEASSQ